MDAAPLMLIDVYAVIRLILFRIRQALAG